VLRTVVVAGLAVSFLVGAGVFALSTVGEEAETTFNTLNEAFADAEPRKGKASAQEVSDWIERYRADATGTRCRQGTGGWDYVCIFRSRRGRRLKMGIVVDWKQPIEMSPTVRLRQRLASPIGS
jgi:hypothetical protein